MNRSPEILPTAPLSWCKFLLVLVLSNSIQIRLCTEKPGLHAWFSSSIKMPINLKTDNHSSKKK